MVDKASSIPPKPNTLCTDVDYKGVVYGTQLAIHFMRQNEPAGGSVVTTASIVGVHPFASLPEYCGAKAAVCSSLLCFEKARLVGTYLTTEHCLRPCNRSHPEVEGEHHDQCYLSGCAADSSNPTDYAR